MKIDIYDMSGKIEETRDIAVPVENALNRDLLSQYTLTYQSNQRQGTVQTKRKGQVRGGGKKPWKQKGTGHARAGSSRSPLWRGGGVTHGPLPRDHSMKLPQKMSRKLFAQLFGYYLTDNKVVGLHFQSDKKDSYSTKTMAQALKSLPVSGKTLIVYGENTGIYESSRNIAHVQVRQAANVNGYDLLSAQCIVCEAGAIAALVERIAL